MKPLLGQNQLSLARDTQMVDLILMQYLNLFPALHEGVTPDLAFRRGGLLLGRGLSCLI
jgi:hypothetical protein